jgi:flagellar hook protein FlgE
MYSGISGLKSNSDALNVVGNNISNVNTIGYKSSSALFEDVLYQTVSSANGSGQVGRGSALSGVLTDFSQGSFQTTSSSTDMAIGGVGFFIVKKSLDTSATPYYTRAGSFSLDKEGYLVDAAGNYLQGKVMDPTTNTAKGVDTNIFIDQAPSKPKATEEVDLRVQLSSTSAWTGTITVDSDKTNIGLTGIAASSGQYPATYGTSDWTVTVAVNAGDATKFDITMTDPDGNTYTETVAGTTTSITNFDGSGLDLAFGTLREGTSHFQVKGFDDPNATIAPSSKSNYSTSLTIYDSQGQPHDVTVSFRKASVSSVDGSSIWEYQVTATGSMAISPSIGTLKFTANGVLDTTNDTSITPTIKWADGAPDQEVKIQLNPSAGQSTQYASASATNSGSQDGYAPGVLQKITVSQDGVISGTYDNGQIVQLYQVTLASFNNPQGLKREGGNLYTATLDSGIAYTNAPGKGGTGKINANSLEQSNVDLASEFVRMIVAQRGYEANSKVITTTDEVLQTLMNLKR